MWQKLIKLRGKKIYNHSQIFQLCSLIDLCDGLDSKESACNVGNPGSIPGLGRCPEVGNVNSCQYSCLENSMDRGAWQATVYGITEWDTTVGLPLSKQKQSTWHNVSRVLGNFGY